MKDIETGKFTLSEHEFVDALELFRGKAPLLDLLIYLLGAPLLVAFYFVPFVVPGFFGLQPSGPGLVGTISDTVGQLRCLLWLFLGTFVTRYLIYRPRRRRHLHRAFQVSQAQYQDNQLRFTDEGIEGTYPHRRSQYDWTLFSTVRDYKNYFFLVYADNCMVLPKRVLDVEQKRDLTQMLRNHIARYEVLG